MPITYDRRNSAGSGRGLYFIKRASTDISRFIATHNIDAAVDYFNTNNAEAPTPEDNVEEIINCVSADHRFRNKYVLKSLFLIGAGAFGSVFRAVTPASGNRENPTYNAEFAASLMRMRKCQKPTRNNLLDAYRDPRCLDCLAIKFETLTTQDIENMSVGKINLIREFAIMTELHSAPESRYATVGLPLPLEFAYIGNERVTKDLNKLIVYDIYGQQTQFKDTYIEKNNVLGLLPENIRHTCYLSLELLGPNLDDWKTMFVDVHGDEGKLAFTAQTVLKLMDQFLCRLIIMHRKNMVHLDLKPDNLCMGVGTMVNTVYLLDYGLSRICSDATADVTMGSRRYMSVGVLNLQPANYMMDLESWFYILLVLLCDYVPWSDEALSCQLLPNEKHDGAREERLIQLVSETKRKFWGDGSMPDPKLLEDCLTRINKFQGNDVPDIKKIVTEIYEHIKKMRQDFYPQGAIKMNGQIKDEDSDLFKRYKILRKLLLYPYNANFTGKGSCFYNDKDMARRQSERSQNHPQLIYAENGRNWRWDWDDWYDDDFGEEVENDNDNNRRKFAPGKRPRHVSDDYRIVGHIDNGIYRVKPKNTKF